MFFYFTLMMEIGNCSEAFAIVYLRLDKGPFRHLYIYMYDFSIYECDEYVFTYF